MPGIHGSKEILPIPPDGEPVAAQALRAMAAAGIRDVLLIIRPEKRDIPLSLGSGASWGVTLEYMETDPTRGPVETLDKAYGRIGDARVALALPDLLMTCPDPYTPLLTALETGPAAVLGVFPGSTLQPGDPVLFDGPGPALPTAGRMGGARDRHGAHPVRAIEPKRARESGRKGPSWCWGVAVWSPRMTAFMHEEVARDTARDWGGDWGLGGTFNRALEAGLGLAGVAVSSDPFLDIGTPDGLALARAGRRTAGR